MFRNATGTPIFNGKFVHIFPTEAALKMEIKLKFLLMGKAGCGKSATGNSLLNRKAFRVSSSVTSTTRDVDYSFGQFNNYILKVVDTPGIVDRNLDSAFDIETAAKNMTKALAMCYDGVDAFLFVIQFGSRFTREDRSILDDLKRIFGEAYMQHVIVVMTRGDLFQEEEELDINFQEWCKEQKGEFERLYRECYGRFVLFNNRESDETKRKAQIQEIVTMAETLQSVHGRYSSECFEKARAQREKLIIELRAPHLTEQIQENISLLTADIEKFVKTQSPWAREKIEKRIQDLKMEIDIQDKGYGVLDNLKKLLENVSLELNDAMILHILSEQLEDAREAKGIWAGLGGVCTVVGGALALAAPPVGVAVIALGAAAGAIGYGVNQVKETTTEQKQKDLQNKRFKT